jgi:cytochrome oxidase assembly protein ShyY1
MDLVLCIDINNNNEACVKTAAIKARRRQNHLCHAIQQISLFLAACIIIAVAMWSLVRIRFNSI